MMFEFSIYMRIDCPEQLRQAAMQHEDADPNYDFIEEDGSVDVGGCIRMLMDPGSLPGCTTIDSIAEGRHV